MNQAEFDRQAAAHAVVKGKITLVYAEKLREVAMNLHWSDIKALIAYAQEMEKRK